MSHNLANHFYRRCVTSLLDSSNMQESLLSLFKCLKEYMPITSIVYMNAYTREKALIIALSDAAVHTHDVRTGLSLWQVKKMYRYRQEFGREERGIWITDPDSEHARHFKALNPDVEIVPPYVYFFMEEDGRILGNVFFKCNQDMVFNSEQRALLDTLRKPLFFLTRSHTLLQEMQFLLDLTHAANRELRQQISGSTSNIIGANGGLSALMHEVRIMAPTEIPVLITGETGTGKEVIAREIHNQSARTGKSFVAVNCGGIPATLIDSELFGHVKGAFTGAMRDYKGRFERAHGGTLFLDEIGELPLEAQTRLLRVLQEHVIERVGGNQQLPVDFRLIAATNRDLRALIQEGKFREDLYFRLRGVQLHIPPLRKRLQDIPLLVKHYLRHESVRMGILPQPLAKGEMEKLLAYSWPGNIRELINVVSEGVARSQNAPVRFNILPDKMQDGDRIPVALGSYTATLAAYFRQALELCSGRIAGPQGAAALTGLHPNTLRAKLDRLGIAYGRNAAK